MVNLKLYLLEFNLKKNIKDKIYFDNCQIGVENCWFVIIITNDECIFSVNDEKTHR